MVPLFESALSSGSNLTASTFNDSRSQLLKLGISLDDVVEVVNEYITEAQQLNNTDIIGAGNVQLEMVLIDYLLRVSIWVFLYRDGVKSTCCRLLRLCLTPSL